MDTSIAFGVSPAYVISLKGEQFTATDQVAALEGIANLGFACFQPELFQPRLLEEWIDGGAEAVGDEASRLGLRASQLVGHFLLEGFANPEALYSDFGINEAGRFASALRWFPGCRTVTVPLPAFEKGDLPAGDEERLAARLEEKLHAVSREVASQGGSLALEVMPGSLIGGLRRLREVMARLDPPVGYNFDTGHAWAAKERVEEIPRLMGKRLVGTHLCDNEGEENRSDCPGRGSIPWKQTLRSLVAEGYRGSWDLEIRCAPEEVAAEYKKGLQFLHQFRRELDMKGGEQ